jgi:hypothetical protein
MPSDFRRHIVVTGLTIPAFGENHCHCTHDNQKKKAIASAESPEQ